MILLTACQGHQGIVAPTATPPPQPAKPPIEVALWDVAFISETTIDVYLPVDGRVKVSIPARNVGSQIWDNQPSPQDHDTSPNDNVSLNYRYYQGDYGIERLENCLGEVGGLWCYTLSAFHCSNWASTSTPEPDSAPAPSKHRPVYVADETAPNEINYFEFDLCFNESSKAIPRDDPYVEHYELAHGGNWFFEAGLENNKLLTVRVFITE